MRNKLFVAALAASIVIPTMVAHVKAEEIVQAEETVTKEAIVDFMDVSKTHSAYKEITAMRAEGIINGYLDNTFKPSISISRQHVAALISRALPLEPIREAKEFNDVPKTHQYYEEIQKLYRAGIVDGKSNGMFDPSANLTRAQMAKILCLAFDLEIQKGYIFEDVGANDWAKDYVATLYVNGITTGDNGKYNGGANVSRAHYAVFLYRLLHPEDAPVPEKPLSPEPIVPVTPPVMEGPATLPDPDKIVTPAGWTEAKATENRNTADELIFKNSPIVASGKQIGIGSYPYTKKNISNEFLEGELYGLNYGEYGANITIKEYIQIVNYVIQTGELYIHSSNTFAMYYNYKENRIYTIA